MASASRLVLRLREGGSGNNRASVVGKDARLDAPATEQCPNAAQTSEPHVGWERAAIMSLIQSARMNGFDPYTYLKDVLTRLPTQRASEIEQLLPHQWGSV